jgi:hypothetical protein
LLATWEVAAKWIATMLLTLAVGHAALRTMETEERRSVFDGKIRTTLEQIGDRLEVRLGLGLDLADIAEAQPLLEQTLARERGLATLDIMDASGMFTASTDRASVRRTAPQEWVESARKGLRATTTGDDRVLFVSLEGSYGERVGAIVATYRLPESAEVPLSNLLVCSSLLVVGLWLVARHFVTQLRRSVVASHIAMLTGKDSPDVPPQIRAAIATLAEAEASVGSAGRQLEAIGKA